MPDAAYYANHREQLKAAALAHHQKTLPHLSDDELERLRRPENRLESLAYGPDKKQQVCLHCAVIFDGGKSERANISRHIHSCPKKPRDNYDAGAYRAYWDFNRTTPLTSPEWHERRSQMFKEQFEQASEEQRESMRDVLAGQRASVSEAREKGTPVRRGPMRAEGVSRRRGRRLPPRPSRQKVPDKKIAEILTLDLPIAEGAKLALFTDGKGAQKHLSQTAFYSRARALGFDAAKVREKRSLINAYIFELRAWVLQQERLPMAEQISERHVAGLRNGDSKLFAGFGPCLPHLLAELRARPETLKELATRESGWAANIFASRIFKRARASAKPSTPRKSSDQRENYKLAKAVHGLLPSVQEGLRVARESKKQWPTDRAKWESALRRAGFTAQADIDALISSRTAPAAAAKVIARRKEVNVHSVQTAYSANRKLLS